MSPWRIYYRDNAADPVARYAGQCASPEGFQTEAEAAEIVRACPNGAQMEIREEAS